jgi:hypothetical protein
VTEAGGRVDCVVNSMLIVVTDSTSVETEDGASELEGEACCVLETMLLVVKADANVVVGLDAERIEEDGDDSAVLVLVAEEEEIDAVLHLPNPA